ncbi:hypothetical protein BgiMline_003714 [Biomphalaria glabrata]|nr:uncharacterized protein LOC106074602 isoform X2 [Biomphalaria glabrata]XP_055870901.1 uncharacterized protein LOC106074602 isoform X2 [Biomphalaria glabrata]KAI8756155.1 hypothetical protein BgiMline_012245 [Biomphalaria glabrata]
MDNHDQLTHDMNNSDYRSAMEAVDKMERDLKELEEHFLKLTVRSYLLEVALAIQFSPDLMLSLERVEKSCEMCAKAVTDEAVAFNEEKSVIAPVQSLDDDAEEEFCNAVPESTAALTE